MNFLLRSSSHAAVEQSPVRDSSAEKHVTSKSGSSLESLIAEDPFPQNSPETNDRESDKDGDENYNIEGLNGMNDVPIVGSHLDVSEEEGWITIPSKALPENWNDVADVQSLRALDRSFVFPGEQIHILACLSAYKQDAEIITPFKVAEVMSKNSHGHSPVKQNGNVECRPCSTSTTEKLGAASRDSCKNGANLLKEEMDQDKDMSAGETLLRRESHRRQTETLLQKFKNSHYFVRISESGDQLWSKKGYLHASAESSEMDAQKPAADGACKTPNVVSCSSAVIDRGNFDANASGGIARDNFRCCSLSTGDIVVFLQVNVGVDSLRDPIIEILQFEKYLDENLSSHSEDETTCSAQDPCGELLKWLLPLDNTLPSPSSSLTPSIPSSSPGISGVSQKANSTTSSGSQLFSFSNFRSYSMSSLPQNTTQPPQPQAIKAVSSKPNFEIDSWEQFSSQKMSKSRKSKTEGILSFRGISLERERFSVCCGLEGIYLPGRRWKRKLEIIKPVEIQSFAADCNTDDLLCVQIKNVSPEHIPDIVVYIDAITIVFEEALNVGPPSSLPISCIEAGDDHSLPNLVLRRGEEHSFILKPKLPTSILKNIKNNGEGSLRPLLSKAGNAAATLHSVERNKHSATGDQYAILVTCRCNYTESKLFFKQPTRWQPRSLRDLMISVASEASGESPDLNGKVSQLPIQVLTLQATNLTSEDLTLTVLAPASFMAPPSVVSLNSSPSTPLSPFVGFTEIQERVNTEKRGAWPLPAVSEHQKRNGNSDGSVCERTSGVSDVVSSNSMACTHLWLQSRVPLGCVPSQSTATIKLELLPLTDGIITLDTLQIDVKEKGLTYVPEHSLKIYATSSISSGIM